MTKQVRVNVRTLANTAAVRRETRNGRDVIIVPSATLPDNIVMNGIRYPAEEIEKSFASLNRTAAPFGHPKVNGKFVSASDPEGINAAWIGAWNENVRRENGRVFLDKVIDVKRAGESEAGKRVLNAIEKQEPIHTSTGLLCKLEAVNGDKEAKHNAREIVFDHDAILLDEDGAATPDEGVGMFVNSSGESEEIEVINSVYSQTENDLDWAVDQAVRAMEKRQKATLYEQVKSAIIGAFNGSERETSTNEKETDMAVSQEQFDALSAKVDTLSESMKPEALANAFAPLIKPLTDNLEAVQNAQRAKDEAELAGLVEKIVNANVMEEAAAKELTLNSARALAGKIGDGKAAPLNGAFTGNNEAKTFKLPKAEA